MTVYQLKGRFQKTLRPIANLLVASGVSPNQITLLACFLSVMYGLSLIFFISERSTLFLFLPAFLLLRMALNAIDGMMAREHGLTTKMGVILNELTDIVADGFIYLAFCFVPGFDPVLLVIFVMLSLLAEMSGVLGIGIGGERRNDGPMGKSDRALVFSVISLCLAWQVPIQNYLQTIVSFLITLSILTIWNRVKNTLASTGGLETKTSS